MPWVVLRDEIAQRYAKWPHEVDYLPCDEVDLILDLMGYGRRGSEPGERKPRNRLEAGRLLAEDAPPKG